MRRKLFSACLLLCLLLQLSVTVFAKPLDLNGVGSISITLLDQHGRQPVAQAEVSVYYVASVVRSENNRPVYSYTADFENCGFALDDPKLAVKLDVFTQEYDLPAQTVVTDDRGKAVLTDLPLGLYFVKQTAPAANNVICMPFLVTVPNYNNDGFIYDVDALPKADVVETTDITVKKVWNVDETVTVAQQVTVQLLRDGAVVKTAVLNEENGWEAVFYDMPRSDAYSVLESNIPEGFTATYTQNGYEFTVINSASLPQTGQVIWPIPLLAVAGLFLIAVGTVCLKKSRERNA